MSQEDTTENFQTIPRKPPDPASVEVKTSDFCMPQDQIAVEDTMKNAKSPDVLGGL